MSYKIRIYIILFLGLALCRSARAQELGNETSISLLTCAPGEALYERYGHTGIRIYDPAQELDITFNYGIFDFSTDHFYWKFVKGETWYELGYSSTRWFLHEYEQEHRPVYEQVLNLTSAQRDELIKALLTNYRPENRKYLYNFVFDNCATRPYILIRSVLGDSLISGYTGNTGVTYRCFIRHYTGALSWSNAGINLLFGPRADKPMSSEERLFLPEELMYFMQQAHLPDGTQVVSRGEIAPFATSSTPWYASWPLGLAAYFVVVFFFSLYDRSRRHWSWGVELAAGIPYVLLLAVVAFLTFFSCHPLVGFGWRLLIIPLTHLCARLIYIIR